MNHARPADARHGLITVLTLIRDGGTFSLMPVHSRNRATTDQAAISTQRREAAALTHRPGDKVRIKTGSHVGVRAVIHRVRRDLITAQVNDADMLIVPSVEVTNYSLAARKAWAVMPKQAGRPKNAGPTKRMVSIRIDPVVWDGLAEMVNAGLIQSREDAVNAWLRMHLDLLREKIRTPRVFQRAGKGFPSSRGG